jgi:cell division protein FtsZ
MGKAMMGTGEASGERRAIQAAEAAIANPLLDETSMKGAKGLLISITGGKDLTLFEVDEAATRIREEVDPDANIILGATFEESLEGVIRVSVVATGIENELREEANPAEPRAETPRVRPASPPAAPPRAPAVALRPSPAVRPAAFAQSAAIKAAQAATAAAPEQHASEPVAPAPESIVARDAGVTIAPFSPAPAAYTTGELDVEMSMQAEPEHTPAEAPFIPPVAETPPSRMPRVEDFPPVVQRQIEARQNPPEEDRGPLSLLRRLASVGLGRREEDPIGAGQASPPTPQRQAAPRLQPRVQMPPAPPASDYAKRPPAPRAPAPDSLYKPRQGDLDPHGRPVPREARHGEDELEIPAFLRRQAN